MRVVVDEVRLKNSFAGSNVGSQLRFFSSKAVKTNRYMCMAFPLILLQRKHWQFC